MQVENGDHIAGIDRVSPPSEFSYDFCIIEQINEMYILFMKIQKYINWRRKTHCKCNGFFKSFPHT